MNSSINTAVTSSDNRSAVVPQRRSGEKSKNQLIGHVLTFLPLSIISSVRSVSKRVNNVASYFQLDFRSLDITPLYSRVRLLICDRPRVFYGRGWHMEPSEHPALSQYLDLSLAKRPAYDIGELKSEDLVTGVYEREWQPFQDPKNEPAEQKFEQQSSDGKTITVKIQTVWQWKSPIPFDKQLEDFRKNATTKLVEFVRHLMWAMTRDNKETPPSDEEIQMFNAARQRAIALMDSVKAIPSIR
jgi:hypothetical protein